MIEVDRSIVEEVLIILEYSAGRGGVFDLTKQRDRVQGKAHLSIRECRMVIPFQGVATRSTAKSWKIFPLPKMITSNGLP